MTIPVAAPVARCLTFTVRGIPFIPHYSQPDVFVGPGGLTLKHSALISMNAEAGSHMLWERAWAQKKGLQAT